MVYAGTSRRQIPAEKVEVTRMIVHSLFLKLKDRSSENIGKTRQILLNMRGKIEQMRDLKVEPDILHGPSSYDLALFARFDTMADFNAYLPHPVHVEVGRQIQDSLAEAAAVCFEE
jgi:hypothetical protein